MAVPSCYGCLVPAHLTMTTLVTMTMKSGRLGGRCAQQQIFPSLLLSSFQNHRHIIVQTSPLVFIQTS